MEQLPLPTNLGEVEVLIRQLYSPNPPETISRIQEVLHRLQRSPDGWQLAQNLIAHPDSNIKFYAALTLIVKLNRESATLNEDDAKELLQNIVGWLLQAVGNGTPAFVIKKLCSALVTHFIYFSQLWPQCIRQLLYCLDIGRSVPVEALDEALGTGVIVANLDSQKLRVAIFFATALVEEVGKTDMNSAKYMEVHARLVRNASDAVSLLGPAFSSAVNADRPTREDALNCFQAWILYSQRVSSSSQHLIAEPLKNLVEPAMNCFADADLFQPAAELFSDVLQNYSTFFEESHYEALAALFDSQWAAEHYSQLIQDSEARDNMSFGLLMLAYGDARLSRLMEGIDDRSQLFLGRLSGLLAAEGYLVGDDHIFVPALEFWSSFVETMIDNTYSDEEESRIWRPHAEQHLKTVVMNCWRKVQWPPVEEFAEWDSTERLAFGDARKDVADMLQSVFTLNGGSLVSFFVDLFLQSIAAQSWAEVEASAFCLSSLSDCITENPSDDYQLGKVFSSPFFDLLSESQGPIPLRLRQTGLSLIERYCEYFERHAEYLPHALNLLFAAVGDSVLGGPSARSISTLCSSCRSILTGEAGAFIRHYQTIRNSQALDSIAEERIVHAIASIIQAIADENQKLQMFEALYIFMKNDFARAVQLKSQPSILNLSDPNFRRGLESSNPQPIPSAAEIALHIALRALRCLSSMAKGMQDVQDHVVDLEADPRPQSRGSLPNIQSDIIRLLVEAQRTFNHSGEVVEIICNILRAGFSETEPGPFVFPADVVTDFFTQQPFETPRLGTLMSTACSFVGSLYRGPKIYVPAHLARLLPWVLGMLRSLPEPESDTEIAQNGISLVDKVMARYPEVLFQLQPPQLLEFFFIFTLKVLNGKEPLPKNAAADFWSGFISLKPDDPALQSAIANAMEHLGPLIAQTLIQNIGGNAARSELDKLSDPLKKLVTQQVRAQAWLEQALFAESFPSTQVTPAEKLAFLKRVVGLRGARQTNQQVRDFWLSCRGSNFTYAS